MDDNDLDFEMNLSSILGPSAFVDSMSEELGKQGAATSQPPALPPAAPALPPATPFPPPAPFPPISSQPATSQQSSQQNNQFQSSQSILPQIAAIETHIAKTDAYSQAGNGHTLGLSFLLSGIGSWIGGSYLGFHGGTGGALAGGATANLIRSYRYSKLGTKDGKREARISVTYGVIGFALASFLFYQGYKKKTARGAEGTTS